MTTATIARPSVPAVQEITVVLGTQSVVRTLTNGDILVRLPFQDDAGQQRTAVMTVTSSDEADTLMDTLGIGYFMDEPGTAPTVRLTGSWSERSWRDHNGDLHASQEFQATSIRNT